MTAGVRVVSDLSHVRHRRRLRVSRWWLAIGAVVALVGAWHLLTRGGALSLAVPGRAASLLAAIEAEAALPVRRSGPVERDGSDGPMPEIAGRRLVVASDAATISARALQACRILVIAPADARRRAIEADALCDGGEGHSGESVHLSLTCEGTCTAYLQTQVVGF